MLKNSDVFGLTRNLETLYSRHVIYSAFLLGSPTFSSATSSKLTPTCYERRALHFHPHSEFAFQASPTPTVSYTFLSLAYVYLYFFRVHAALITEIYLCPQSCLWYVAAEFPEKAAVLFFGSLQEKTLSKEHQQLVKKTLLQLQKNLRGCCAYPLFLITALLQGCHSCPDVFGSSLFS